MNLGSYVKNNLLILNLFDFPLLLFASIFPFYFLSVILFLNFPTTKQNLFFFSFPVNGVLAGFFPSSKGLRQGDPLSPYLFVLGMEVLDALIRRAVAGGYLSGCSIQGGRRHNLKISHLFLLMIQLCSVRLIKSI